MVRSVLKYIYWGVGLLILGFLGGFGLVFLFCFNFIFFKDETAANGSLSHAGKFEEKCKKCIL